LLAGVHDLPRDLDQRVARMRLAALGLATDHLSASQEAYLSGWGHA